MAKTLTFLDSNVLIAAATGRFNYSTVALTVISDPAREFASSPFVRLETVPKATFHRKKDEVSFYEDYFNACAAWDDDFVDLVGEAERVGGKFGLNMGDALHVAAALRLGAADFVTGERPTSPLKFVTGIQVLSIYQP
jgi:predicted nucleic acid-binding protein